MNDSSLLLSINTTSFLFILYSKLLLFPDLDLSGIILFSYVTAFLNLPRLIEQKNIKSVIWAQGCCITTLNQNYEPDADWRSFGSLWSLKNIFL